MKFYINDDGYVYLHAEDWEKIPDGYKQVADETIDIEHFIANRNCYKWENNRLTYHPEREKIMKDSIRQDGIRKEREIICFPIINRGQLWYEMITAEQRKELEVWYQAWLDAPQTLKIPNMPGWLA